MKRAVLAAALVLACVRLSGATVVGVYFVHGKGAHDLINQGSAWTYWDSGRFMSWVTESGCGVPTDYSHVDGTFRLEDAAFGNYYWDGWTQGGGYYVTGGPGVSDQMANFIRQWGVTDLIVVTHSMGGNVVREVLSDSGYWNWCADPAYNGTWDPTCVAMRENQRLVQRTVKAVFALAAPFTGSEAADVATALKGSWPSVAWIGQWLSGGDASTGSCTTRRMKTYNANQLYGTAGRGWPADNPARNVTWVQMASWNLPSQMANDYLHAEDGGLVTTAGLVAFPDNLSDGLVSWASQRAVGSANTNPPPYSTLFRDNHFHSKYVGTLSESCATYGWSGSCYPSGRAPECASYLGTCPSNTPVVATGDWYQCLAHTLCIGTPYGADAATRIQNTVWALAGQRCGYVCRGCGILACSRCCPMPFC